MEKGNLFYIARDRLPEFINKIARKVDLFFAPKTEGEICHFRQVKEELSSYQYNPEKRPLEPLKTFIYPPKEIATRYFEKSFPSVKAPFPKRLIWGVKGCDLASLKTWNLTFLPGDLADPEYKRRLEDTILISSDCLEVEETCFCHLVEGSPFAQEGFDLNLSLIAEGFLVELGRDKGRKLIEENLELFRPASLEEKKLRDENRAKTKAKLTEINKCFEFKKPLTGIVKESYTSPDWREVAQDCIECGACTNICPTCYCFLLYEGKKRDLEEFLKMKIWDSCQLLNFARVAGGENPRKRLYERLRHRLVHKFDYFPERSGLIACTGCGRCIEACMGKIDMREIFKKLSETTEAHG